MASIGIWWLVDGRILCTREPADTVLAVNGWRDTSIGHFEHWEILKTSQVELAHHDYTDFPRGRVLFREADQNFVIYGGDKLLRDPELQNQIAYAFGLDRNKTKIAHDKHYDNAFPLLDDF